MTTLTVKANGDFRSVSRSLQADAQGATLFTVKHKQGDVTGTVEFTDKTANDLASLNVSGCSCYAACKKSCHVATLMLTPGSHMHDDSAYSLFLSVVGPYLHALCETALPPEAHVLATVKLCARPICSELENLQFSDNLLTVCRVLTQRLHTA